IDFAVWHSFTSARHGITIKHPADWAVTPATAPWPIGTDGAAPPDPMLVGFADPGNNGQTFVVLSQPLARGQTGAAWLARYQAAAVTQNPVACWPPVAQWERVKIDGVDAWIHGGIAGCAFTEAIAF